jgi:DNA-binding transcriptional MerR regulator/methylmalonyl-CoA mutase cobalamin-binding subunit
MSSKNFYTIRYVSQRSGLSPHVIRAWEKRYQAVVPQRSPKNRRLYSEDDVKRLQLLKNITDAGHTISQVANLSMDVLSDLAQREASATPRVSKTYQSSSRQSDAHHYYEECLSAVLNLDSEKLELAYDRALIDLTRPLLIGDVIVPLFEEIGNLWRNGSLKIVNEHMASSVTRTFLLNLLRATEVSDSAPRIVIATTAGQWHDIGALIVAMKAAEYGWQAVYFGPNLPAEEIAAGVKQSNARAVAVSITHLLDPHPLIEELRKLRRYVGESVALFLGGQGVGDHTSILDAINVKIIADLEQLSEELRSLLSTQPE